MSSKNVFASVQNLWETSQGSSRQHTYTRDVVLTASQILTQQQIACDRDGWFFLQRSACYAYVTASGPGSANIPFRFALNDVNGQGYSSVGSGVTGGNNRLRSDCCFGDGKLPYIFLPTIIYLPRGVIGYDIQEITAQAVTVHFELIGFLFYPDVNPYNE